MNYKIHKAEDLPQQSDEWYEMHQTRLTSSDAQAIGNYGSGLKSAIFKKMAEYYSTAEKERYRSVDMKRGNELEPTARKIYELENGVEVEEVGFIELEDYKAGCSPDGLVGDDGLVEIKCLKDINHYKLTVNGKKEMERKYLWQIQMQLLITGRDWCDLVYYNPNYKQSIVKFRIEPVEDMQDELMKGIKKGTEEINKHLKRNDDK